MRILGIDPGSITTGFGVIDKHKERYNYVASGCIKLGRFTLAERLQRIFLDVSKVIETYNPQILSIERVFVHKNVASALKLGHARGVAIVAAANSGLITVEYSPREIKQSVVGYGNAEKQQVQLMVKSLLKLDGMPASDAADALAIALCHGFTNNLRKVI